MVRRWGRVVGQEVRVQLVEQTHPGVELGQTVGRLQVGHPGPEVVHPDRGELRPQVAGPVSGNCGLPTEMKLGRSAAGSPEVFGDDRPERRVGDAVLPLGGSRCASGSGRCRGWSRPFPSPEQGHAAHDLCRLRQVLADVDPGAFVGMALKRCVWGRR